MQYIHFDSAKRLNVTAPVVMRMFSSSLINRRRVSNGVTARRHPCMREQQRSKLPSDLTSSVDIMSLICCLKSIAAARIRPHQHEAMGHHRGSLGLTVSGFQLCTRVIRRDNAK